MSETIAWIRFAAFSPDLLYAVLQLRQAAFVVEQRSPYADLDGHDQHALHLLVTRGGGLTGYLRIVPWPAEQKVTIGRVVVAPACRRGGTARGMMRLAIERARQDHPGWRIALSAQVHLVPFYEQFGFRTVSEPYDDCGVPHRDMVLTRQASAFRVD